MPMNLDAVGAVSDKSKTSWSSKDALLYALGVGAGQTDPTGFELEFTSENSQGIEQRVLPTMRDSRLAGPDGIGTAAPLVAGTPAGLGNTEQIADSLFGEYLLPFELVSVLLLVAVVGSVVMAKKRI